MNFEAELEKGKLLVGECLKCKKTIWPPSEFCNKCFGEVILRPCSKDGKIIECSSKDGIIFCIAEFENEVRIIGNLKTHETPRIGQKIRLEKCGIINGKYIFEMSL